MIIDKRAGRSATNWNRDTPHAGVRVYASVCDNFIRLTERGRLGEGGVADEKEPTELFAAARASKTLQQQSKNL